jgi:hypothetical protein
MSGNNRVLNEALNLALTTYCDMHTLTIEAIAAAQAELQSYLPKLIEDGPIDRTRLAVAGLKHLKEVAESRIPPLPYRQRRLVRSSQTV